jgi:hypothetical protein
MTATADPAATPGSGSSLTSQLRRSALMLLPGGAAILATAGLATGRIGEMSSPDATRFLVFLQVELLALGIGRLGFDQLVLSRAILLDNPDALSFTGVLARRVLPVAVLVAAVLALIVGQPAGLAVLIAAPADVLSVVTGSFELGRRKYWINIAFTWINFPVFLFFLVVPGVKIDSSQLSHVLALFCATSVVRALVSLVLLSRHLQRRRRLAPSEQVQVVGKDLLGAGIVSSCQNIIPRLDGLVLAGFDGRFSSVAVSSYLVAIRLLDASYSVSGVFASLDHVDARGRHVVRSIRQRAGRTIAWVAMWCIGAIILAALRWPDVFVGWGRFVLVVPAAALHVVIFRHVLVELAESHTARVARRFGCYLAVAAVCAALAVVTKEPALMLLAASINGTASLVALRRRAAESPAVDQA